MKVVFAEEPRLQHDLLELADGVALPPLMNLLGRPVAAAGVGNRMAAVPVRVGLDEAWPVPASGTLSRLLHGSLDGKEVHAVDALRWDPVAVGLSPQVGDGRGASHRRAHAVLIVDQ